MPYQSHPASMVDLLAKLNYRVNKDDGNRKTDGQTEKWRDAGDDNNHSAEDAEG